jgi:uncharacterized protein YjiS (DUF1127 family)
MRPNFFDFDRYQWRGELRCPSPEIVELTQAAAALVRLWRWRIHGRVELARLDGHALRDIGITAAEASHEYRKPFWRG